AFAGGAGAPIGSYTTKNTYSFVSAPALHPPKIASAAPAAGEPLAPGYIMVTNFYDLTKHPMVGQSGPLILDDQLQPVWFRPVPKNVIASNLSAQTYDGKPVLTWWQGTITNTGATETGTDIVVDSHYRTIAKVSGKNGWILTLHELVIRGDDAWVTANKNIPMDLTKYGGARNGALTDSAVQEYSLETGKLLYSWDALDHIPLSDSHTPPPPNGFPWDAYHVNSIQVEGNGAFLTSMRDTFAAYQVNIATGQIEWTLGGKHSTFTFGKDATFEWQHDVRLNGNELTVFDDDCCEITGAGTYLSPDGPTRGRVHGQPADAAERRRLRRLGQRAELLGVHAQRQAAARGRVPLPRSELSRPAPAVDRRAREAAGCRGADDRRPYRGVRELERLDEARRLARARSREAGRARAEVRLRDRDPGGERRPVPG